MYTILGILIQGTLTFHCSFTKSLSVLSISLKPFIYFFHIPSKHPLSYLCIVLSNSIYQTACKMTSQSSVLARLTDKKNQILTTIYFCQLPDLFQDPRSLSILSRIPSGSVSLLVDSA